MNDKIILEIRVNGNAIGILEYCGQVVKTNKVIFMVKINVDLIFGGLDTVLKAFDTITDSSVEVLENNQFSFEVNHGERIKNHRHYTYTMTTVIVAAIVRVEDSEIKSSGYM